MKNYSIVAIALLLITTYSCQEASGYELVIKNQFSNTPTINLRSISQGVDTFLVADETGVFKYTLDIEEPTLMEVILGKNSKQVIVDKGIQTSLTIDSAGSLVVADSDIHNRGIETFSAKADEIRKNLNPLVYFAHPLDSFKIAMEERFQPLDTIVDNLKQSPVYPFLQNDIAALKLADASIYPNYHNYIKKDSIKFPEEFTQHSYGLGLDDPSLLASSTSQRALMTLADRAVDMEEGMSYDAYINKNIAHANEHVSNASISHHLVFKKLTDRINYGGGIDGIEKEMEALLASTDNVYYHNEIGKLKKEWSKLRAGLDAPEFDAYDREGNAVNLEDLQGKAVYIDVWATWCGPCIAEIPSLKEVEKDYHDANISFVSVSIDKQSDAEKWKKFIVDRELGGVQLMAENDWQSDIAKGYNIKGIPRFILIDKEGKIVRADAPRPSSSEIRDLLDNHKS